MRKAWYRFALVLTGLAMLCTGCRACGSGEDAKVEAPKPGKIEKTPSVAETGSEESSEQKPQKPFLEEQRMRPGGDTAIKPGATLRMRTPKRPRLSEEKPGQKQPIDAEESRRTELEWSKKPKKRR